MRAALALAVLPLMVGCKEAIVAPTELNELSRYLFLEWDNEDPAVMSAGVTAFDTWAAGVETSPDASLEDRFYTITALTRPDVEGLVNHDLDPAAAPAVAVITTSAFAVADHAGLFGLADQRPLEPSSPDKYDREITDGDADCFAERGEGCETLASTNDINRKNLLVDVDYILTKVWRWVDLEDGRQAIATRAYTPDEGTSEDPEKYIKQVYTVELWIPTADGAGTTRWLVTWQEAELGLDEDTVESLVASSMDDSYKAVEDYLSAGGQ